VSKRVDWPDPIVKAGVVPPLGRLEAEASEDGLYPFRGEVLSVQLVQHGDVQGLVGDDFPSVALEFLRRLVSSSFMPPITRDAIT
jgi:hypothetical protein